MADADGKKLTCSVRKCSSPCFAAPIRHVVVVFLFFLIIIMYGHRVALSIAIVEMVEPIKKKSNVTACPATGNTTSSVIIKIEGGKIKWSEEVQSYVLLSFYIGYTLFHIPGGFLCDKYGAKYFLIGSSVVSSASMLVVPIIVMKKLNWIVIFMIRCVCGAAQAIVFPGVTSLLSRWAPPAERGTLGAVSFSANSIGTVIGTMFSGLAIHYLQDWTIVFYAWALIGFIWCPLFWFWSASDPIYSHNITDAELEMIKATIVKKHKRPVPWKAMFMDGAVWAMIICQMGHNYLLFTLISNLPKYMNNVLNYNIKSNAYLSSAPYLALYISSVLAGKIMDEISKKHNARRELMRKLYVTISAVIPGVLLLGAGFANCDRVTAMTCFVSAMFFKGPFYSSLKINGMDLSSSYAGNLMSISNGIGALSGIATPFIIGKFAPDNTLAQWHLVYALVCIISILSAVFYDIFAKSDRAVWDYGEDETVPPKRKRKYWYLEEHPDDTLMERKP